MRVLISAVTSSWTSHSQIKRLKPWWWFCMASSSLPSRCLATTKLLWTVFNSFTYTFDNVLLFFIIEYLCMRLLIVFLLYQLRNLLLFVTIIFNIIRMNFEFVFPLTTGMY